MDFSQLILNLKEGGNFRKIPEKLPPNFIDFTSNDYLGLASDINLSKEFLSTIEKPRFSSSSSRLLASCQEEYFELESLLSTIYGRSALLFNSGYHANLGVISAIASDSKILIIADKLSHASIIDGVILSRADYRRFPHNDIKSLRDIIRKNEDKYDYFLVITESVFSMDGDEAPLDELLKIKKEFPKVVLYLDESHALGVRGPQGLGLSQESEFPEEWDIIVYPMGKGAASMGAFVICSEDMKEYLVNRSRSLIFSTVLPPIQIQWSRFIFQKFLKMDPERAYLKSLSEILLKYLNDISSQKRDKASHILPLIIGDSFKTMEISDFLYQNKIKALPIRRPTVPPGTERLRFSLSAAMQEEDIHRLGEILSELKFNNAI